MGAEGFIYIYDARPTVGRPKRSFDGGRIIEDGLYEDFFNYFTNSYDWGVFLGKRLFSAYGEDGTDRHPLTSDRRSGDIFHKYRMKKDENFDKNRDPVGDYFEVWT